MLRSFLPVILWQKKAFIRKFIDFIHVLLSHYKLQLSVKHVPRAFILQRLMTNLHTSECSSKIFIVIWCLKSTILISELYCLLTFSIFQRTCLFKRLPFWIDLILNDTFFFLFYLSIKPIFVRLPILINVLRREMIVFLTNRILASFVVYLLGLNRILLWFRVILLTLLKIILLYLNKVGFDFFLKPAFHFNWEFSWR